MRFFLLIIALALLSSSAIAASLEIQSGSLVDSFACEAKVELAGKKIQKSYQFASPRQQLVIANQDRQVNLSGKMKLTLQENLDLIFNLYIETIVDSTSQAFESCEISIELDQDGKASSASHPVSLFLPIPTLDGEIQIHGTTSKIYSPLTNEEIGSFSCSWLGAQTLQFNPVK